MKPLTLNRAIVLLAGAVLATAAVADDKDAYNLRRATDDLSVFHRLARDGALHREDIEAGIDFAPRFDAADANRDGKVTAEEMDQYVTRTYGVKSMSSAGASRR
jgi:hypothetical protein